MMKKPLFNYIVVTILVFMIAVMSVLVYASVYLKERVIVRTTEQTRMISDLIARSAYGLMRSGHADKSYAKLLTYRDISGVDYIGIFRPDGTEAFTGAAARKAVRSSQKAPARAIGEDEKATFVKAVETMCATGFFDRDGGAYSRYVPLMAEVACLKCHSNEKGVLGVLKIRMSAEMDFDFLRRTQNLIWILGFIAVLPVGALFVAGAVIRDKNRLYEELKKSNTSLKEAYGDINRTEFYLQLILDNSKALIITTDCEGKIVEFNREAQTLLGYTKEEAVGEDVLMLYETPRHRKELVKDMSGDSGVWEVRNRDVRLKSKTGKVYDVSLTLSSLLDRDGKVIGTVGVGKDTTEQKMLQFKLLQAEKLAGIGTLASGIAHEINNPLAGILGMAEAIMDEDDIETIRSHTGDIIRYTETANNIVRGLSNYSRSAQNTSASAVDLAAVIHNSVKMARHSAAIGDIEIHTDIHKGCFINANPVEVQQVFVNLAINAVQAMGGKGVLVLKCWKDGPFTNARISDTGSGIPEKDLSHIFDPFFTTKPVGKGTGLGLYVVYRIVTKYGGSIDVESREGVGTAFTIKFPSSSRTVSAA